MLHNLCGQAQWPPPPLVTPENTTSQLVGSKVLIHTNNDETYQGIVKRVWGDSEKISLDKVVAVPSQKIFIGLLYFFKQDILKITIVQPPPQKKGKKSKTEKCAVQLKPLPFGQIENEEDTASEEGDNIRPVEVIDDAADYARTGEISWETGENKDDRETCKPSDLGFPLPTKYITLDEINSEFIESIDDLNQHSTLGVSLESTKGRLGEIIILSVATESVVYLYDIMTLGRKGFDRGLASVLESPSIRKVMHDCRMPSDGLFHLFKVKLNNIFDTQVGDVVCYMKDNNNSLPHHVASLRQCLIKYLKVDPQFLPADQGIFRGLQKDLSRWKTRPIIPSCREQAIRNVIFLQELRQSILDKILADFTLGVSIYLSAVRDASQEELALNLGSPDVLPPAMSRIASKDIEFVHRSQTNVLVASSHNIWNQNSNSGPQRGGQSVSQENKSKNKRSQHRPTSRGTPKQMINGVAVESLDCKFVGDRRRGHDGINRGERRSFDDLKKTARSGDQSRREGYDLNNRSCGNQSGCRDDLDHNLKDGRDLYRRDGCRSRDNQSASGDHNWKEGDDLSNRDKIFSNDHKLNESRRSFDDEKRAGSSSQIGYQGQKSGKTAGQVSNESAAPESGDGQCSDSLGNRNGGFQGNYESDIQKSFSELRLRQGLGNFPWTSDTRSLPMDKCSPAGKMLPPKTCKPT